MPLSRFVTHEKPMRSNQRFVCWLAGWRTAVAATSVSYISTFFIVSIVCCMLVLVFWRSLCACPMHPLEYIREPNGVVGSDENESIALQWKMARMRWNHAHTHTHTFTYTCRTQNPTTTSWKTGNGIGFHNTIWPSMYWRSPSMHVY